MVEKNLAKQNHAERRCNYGPRTSWSLGKGAHVVYIDSSCLIKIFRREPETPAVLKAIVIEPEVLY